LGRHLEPHPATGNLQRVAVDRLAFVKRAKTLGFSLGEIRELLAIQDGHTYACVEVRDLVQNKLAIVRNKKAEIERLEANLASALRKCNQALRRKRSQHSETCPVLKQIVPKLRVQNLRGIPWINRVANQAI